MPFPNQDYSKRDCKLPGSCKDLAHVVKRERASISPRRRQPRIKWHVGLPEMVAVKYVAELSGQDLQSLVAVMSELRILVSVERSIGFEDAARILRRYGIAAHSVA
jgi:hypothetical protein